jgi:hypothetical protein
MLSEGGMLSDFSKLGARRVISTRVPAKIDQFPLSAGRQTERV